MGDAKKEYKELERILVDAAAKPVCLSYEVLRKITNNFAQMIGRGGFGEVYMGMLRNGKVAVKKLYKVDEFSEKQFLDELTCLIRVNDKYIVRFLGYCSFSQQQLVEYNGRHVLADVPQRFLCFEYVPNKSIYDYLKGIEKGSQQQSTSSGFLSAIIHTFKDESKGRDWNKCYQLIEGICKGLRYLHNEHIIHLDLKPENILLDADTVPKITDFGLSRRFGGEQSKIITKTILGTPGYIAPERFKGEISFKSDIFSLGIIIMKLLRGSNDWPDLETWHQPLDTDCPKLKRCIKIAQLCVEDDPRKRPTTDDIIDEIRILTALTKNNLGSSNEQVHQELLHYPAEGRLPTLLQIRGVLSVTVVLAEDLPPMDIDGKADPFVILYLKKGETKGKTRVVADTLNPIWNQTFDFVVEDAMNNLLMVEVWHHDTFAKDFVGRCIFTLTRVLHEGEFRDTFVLEDAKSGKLNLHFYWTQFPKAKLR